jgi:type IV pilus assembly protein PilY1
MGAIINSEPAVSRDDGVVYVPRAKACCMPSTPRTRTRARSCGPTCPAPCCPTSGQTTPRAYTFKTQLDGSPVIGKTGTSSKLLVAGMGAAGRSYYAIDVSSPRGLTETTLAANVKWEFPSRRTPPRRPRSARRWAGRWW